MVYPTSLPADAASVAVFEEGMSPEYDITWSFTYEPINIASGDEIGFCLFLQDADVACLGGGVGPDVGFTGTDDLGLNAEPLNGKILGVGFDSLGAFGLPISDYGGGDTRDGLATVVPNGVHVRDADGNIVSTESLSAFDLTSEGKKTVRARLGNFGRTLTVDYKLEGQEFFTQVLKQDVTLTFTSSTRYRPGVALVKPITASSVTGDIVVDGFHVEGNQNSIQVDELAFTPLVPFTNNTDVLGPVPQGVPTSEDKPRLPFLGMEPHVGCADGSCGTAVSTPEGFYPSTFLYQMSAFIGDVDVDWSTTGDPYRFVIRLDGDIKLDTGFVGNESFNYGGASRSTFVAGILSSSNHGSYTTTALAPDGYPYVYSTLTSTTSSFYKDTDTSRALVEVFEPLSTTNWTASVGCPFYTLSCGVEDEYLCGLTQQHETLRKIVFTNLDTLY
tara:strand:- start:2629 stop:3963 length:1335 start_codon:yes stop_codon:yes gene_type:complete